MTKPKTTLAAKRNQIEQIERIVSMPRGFEILDTIVRHYNLFGDELLINPQLAIELLMLDDRIVQSLEEMVPKLDMEYHQG